MSTEGGTAADLPHGRWADPAFLRRVQYADAGNFSARQSIYRYQQPRIGLYDWALDLAGLDGDERILDVGCGNGGYLKALHQRGHRGLVVGVDFSARRSPSCKATPQRFLSQPARSTSGWRCTCCTTCPTADGLWPSSGELSHLVAWPSSY